jgi:hypothetical protein
MFENRVLRKIFGPKTDEGTGEWRELHSEELHNLYSFVHQIKENEVGRASGTHRGGQKSVKILVGKPKGKRPLSGPRH